MDLFLQSLQLLSQIQLIYIDTEFINPKQFIDLIEKVQVYSVYYFVLKFYNKDPTIILEYTGIIRYTQLMFDTRLCLDLWNCNLTNDAAVNIFSNTNQILFSLIMYGNEYSSECQQQIANQITALEYISIGNMRSGIVLSALCRASQLKTLSLT